MRDLNGSQTTKGETDLRIQRQEEKGKERERVRETEKGRFSEE